MSADDDPIMFRARYEASASVLFPSAVRKSEVEDMLGRELEPGEELSAEDLETIREQLATAAEERVTYDVTVDLTPEQKLR